MAWSLQDAKNRLSEVVRRSQKEGPQTITLRGEPAAVVISAETYEELTAKRPSLVDHLLSGPPWPDDLIETINARAKRPSRNEKF